MTARSYLGVWLGSLGILMVVAFFFPQPGYMDAYYYYHVANNLTQGKGLTEEFVWNYLALPEAVSHPSNLYWMPLNSLIAAPFLWLGGPSYRIAQAPFVLIASLVPPLAAWLGWRLFQDRRYALGGASLTLFSGFYLSYWTSLDSFGLYTVVVTLALYLTGKLMAAPQGEELPTARGRTALLAGGCGLLAAVAHLARADGVLLLPVLAGALFASKGGRRAAGLLALALMVYLVAMSPWLVRNLRLIGAPLPTAGGKTVFLQEYNDFYSYQQPLDWGSYLSEGMGPVLAAKGRALGWNLSVLYGMEYYLAPLGLLGLWGLRRRRELFPFLLYAMLLYLVMSLLFTYPSTRGSMLHSGVALLPWTALAAVHGIHLAVAWVGSRLPHWNVPVAQVRFTIIAVMFSAGMSLFLTAREAWSREDLYQRQLQLASWFEGHTSPTSLVMLTNPPAYFYASGRPSVVTPTNGMDALFAVAVRYGVDYLALEPAYARVLGLQCAELAAHPRMEQLATLDDTCIYRVGPAAKQEAQR